jgi:phosphatidylglycerophosphate synthase
MSRLKVALFWPNILCYARIALAFVGLFYAKNSNNSTNNGDNSIRSFTAIVLWIGSAFLDLFDGLLARLLNQSSQLGVLLDIIADNTLRTSVWVAVAMVTPHAVLQLLAVAIVCTEWITLVVTQLHAVQRGGEHWKKQRENDPWIVQTFFANNFRNPLGAWGIVGLFSANLFAYGAHFPAIYSRIPGFYVFMLLACAGRLLSFIIELWLCWGYLSYLLDEGARPFEVRK